MAAPIGDPDDLDLAPALPPRKRDRHHPQVVQAYLGYTLVAIFAAVVLFLMWQTAAGHMDTREFAEIVFPAVLALASAAVGFYFRELTEHRD